MDESRTDESRTDGSCMGTYVLHRGIGLVVQIEQRHVSECVLSHRKHKKEKGKGACP